MRITIEIATAIIGLKAVSPVSKTIEITHIEKNA